MSHSQALLLCIHHCCGTSPSTGQWERSSSDVAQAKGRASLGHGGGRDTCLETTALFLCDLAVSSRPRCCPQLCHVLWQREGSGLSKAQATAARRTGLLLLTVPGSSWERMRQVVGRKADGDHLWHRNWGRLVKFLSTGKPRKSHPAEPGMHGDTGQLLCGGDVTLQ